MGKLNVDENPGIASRYGVTSIPTLIFFKDGEARDHMIGVLGRKCQKSDRRQIKRSYGIEEVTKVTKVSCISVFDRF